MTRRSPPPRSVWRVEGMTCGHCVTTVKDALFGVPGVEDASVVVGEAVVSGGEKTKILQAIEAVGFDATEEDSPGTEEQTTLIVEGMSCGQCEEWVSSAMARVDRVDRAVADFRAGTATAWGIGVSRSDLEKAVVATGYKVAAAENNDQKKENVAPSSAGFDSSSSKPQSLLATIRITGMSCAACSSRVERALAQLDDVESVTVNPLTETAVVSLLERRTSTAELLERTVVSSGYGVDGSTQFDDDDSYSSQGSAVATFETDDMVCASCPGRISRVLSRIVLKVEVVSNRIEVTYDARNMGARDVKKKIRELGYETRLAADDESERWGGAQEDEEKAKKLARVEETRRLKCDTIAALALAAPLALGMYLKVGTMTIIYGVSGVDLASWLLATPIQFYLGRRFYTGSFVALSHCSANMDVLVALGSTSAYAYSVFAVVAGSLSRSFDGRPCFETSAMLLAFVLLGKYLEARAKGKTSQALQTLLKLRPAEAILVVGDEEEVAAAQTVRRGDLVRIKPGARIPADAVVTDGHTNVDESMLTGESMPVAKRKDDQVFGGTLNVGPGSVVARVSAVGSKSMLASIVRLVERAQGSKTEIEATADVVARHFVLFVVVASVATFVGWFSAYPTLPPSWFEDPRFLTSFLFSIAVLVVACPCALGLATPTAVMVGTGLGAKFGVLIKGGRPLEVAHNVTAVVFDKTGTLTVGEPRVTDVVVFDDQQQRCSPEELAMLVAAAETGSEHPLARALAKAPAVIFPSSRLGSSNQWRSVTFEAVVGEGVNAVVENDRKETRSVSIGTRTLVCRERAPLSPSSESKISELESTGKTVVLVRVESEIVGCAAVADAARDEARSAVAELRRRGLEVWMITGDGERAAKAIAEKVGIENVFARARPQDKAQRVEELGSRRVVAVVGDGVNDGPALAAADLGIAIGAGAQLAVEAADVVLVRNRIDDVLVALDISRATFKRIQTNLVFSLIFNSLAIPLAAGALFPFTKTRLPPQVAALAMVCSSVSVLASSLSLAAYEPESRKDATESDLRSKKRPCGRSTTGALSFVGSLRKLFVGRKKPTDDEGDDPQDSLTLPLISPPQGRGRHEGTTNLPHTLLADGVVDADLV